MADTVRKALGVIAVAVTTAMLAPAQAAVVHLTAGTHGHGHAHGHGQGAGHADPAGRPAPQGRAGGLRGTVDFNANEEAQGWTDMLDGSFIAYSVEPHERPHGVPSARSAAYRVVSATAYGWSADLADRIGRLMSHVAADPARVDTADESIALQLALWNLVDEPDGARGLHRGLGHGRGHPGGRPSAFEDDADQLLADAATAQNRYEVYVLSKGGRQDLLLLRAVPEPATWALFLAALGGLGLARGRRGAGTEAAAR
jgi:hypothetical protein